MKEKSQVVLLGEFIEAVTQAVGCSWQMIHLQKDMKWAIIRDTLEKIKEISAAVAVGKIQP